MLICSYHIVQVAILALFRNFTGFPVRNRLHFVVILPVSSNGVPFDAVLHTLALRLVFFQIIFSLLNYLYLRLVDSALELCRGLGSLNLGITFQSDSANVRAVIRHLLGFVDAR